MHDASWEGSGSGYHTVFQDDDLYRMYYKAWQHVAGDLKPHGIFGGYAESQDGIHWVKPELGIFEFNGSKKNNIVWSGPGSHDFTVFKDANPKCKAEARYKAVARNHKDAKVKGLLAFQSPDGIHWSLMCDKPIITEGAFDSQNLAF